MHGAQQIVPSGQSIHADHRNTAPRNTDPRNTDPRNSGEAALQVCVGGGSERLPELLVRDFGEIESAGQESW